MKTYLTRRSETDLPTIVLMSHGPLCISIIESAEMILTDIENVAAFALEEGDDPEAYGAAVQKAIDGWNGNVIALVDLLGGTPSNQVMRIIRNNPALCAISGLNLTMLLEAVGSRESETDREELAKYLIEVGKNGIVNLSDIVRNILQNQ